MTGIRKIKAMPQETWAWIILILSGIFLLTIAFFSDGIYGDTDSIGHYQIARYAFRHPGQLVSHWGKPLFTILAAPFAQFGLKGVITFNILCGLAAAWLVYKMARKLNYRYALAAIPFALFAPIFMVNLFTSLTEILFALVLVLSIYLFLKERFILSAVTISLIPYARNEGLIFLAIFLVAFLLVKRFKAIPFLFTGFILFSIAGYFHYRDLFWFFTAMPYNSGGSELYGSGSFWYYFKRLNILMGLPLTILTSSGLIYLFTRLFTSNRPGLSVSWMTQYLLITGSFFAFVLAHSFLWWQGMLGVLASKRFMACIMPLGGFFALAGLNFLLSAPILTRRINALILVLAIGSVIITPFTLDRYPLPLVQENQVCKMTADAIMRNNIPFEKVKSSDPKVSFFMDADPYDQNGARIDRIDYSKTDFGLEDSSILVWEPHFAGFEGKLTLDRLLENPLLQPVDAFVPDDEYKIWGQNYMAVLFMKNDNAKVPQNWMIADSTSFETYINDGNEEKKKHFSDLTSYSGSQSFRIDSAWPYSPSIQIKLAEFQGKGKILARVRVKVYNPGDAEVNKIVLVLSVMDGSGEMFRYINVTGKNIGIQSKQWQEMYLLTPVNTNHPADGTIKIYAWYRGKGSIYVDDLHVEYLPVEF